MILDSGFTLPGLCITRELAGSHCWNIVWDVGGFVLTVIDDLGHPLADLAQGLIPDTQTHFMRGSGLPADILRQADETSTDSIPMVRCGFQ
jgi:hypothetical protein